MGAINTSGARTKTRTTKGEEIRVSDGTKIHIDNTTTKVHVSADIRDDLDMVYTASGRKGYNKKYKNKKI